MRFGHNFWLGGPIDLRSTGTAFWKIFSEIPHSTIFGTLKYAPKYAKYGQICIFGAYLGTPKMVKCDLAKCCSVNFLQWLVYGLDFYCKGKKDATRQGNQCHQFGDLTLHGVEGYQAPVRRYPVLSTNGGYAPKSSAYEIVSDSVHNAVATC